MSNRQSMWWKGNVTFPPEMVAIAELSGEDMESTLEHIQALIDKLKDQIDTENEE